MASMNEIAKAINLNEIDEDGRYEYIGIRVQDDAYGMQVGQTVEHNSHVWIDGDETDEELNGVCAIYAEAIGRISTTYYGDTVIILGSQSAEYGEDDGEIIMQDAVVLAVMHL